MTADVPRRLPRTQGQRVQNVARTHAAQSLGGATAAARPVQNTTPTPTIYKPPSTGGSNVVTGTGDPTSVSIESTTPGDGAVHASGEFAVAMGLAVAAGNNTVAIGNGANSAAFGSTTVGGAQVHETSTYGTALGNASRVRENSENGTAVGGGSVRWADNGTAIGSAVVRGTSSTDRASYGTAVGAFTFVGHAGGVAIGADHDGNSAETTAQDDFVLGTANHHVIVHGGLILADGSGGLWRITVSGGALSAVAYP